MATQSPPIHRAGGALKPDRTVWPTARLSVAGTPVPTYDDGFPKAHPSLPPGERAVRVRTETLPMFDHFTARLATRTRLASHCHALPRAAAKPWRSARSAHERAAY